MIGAIIPLILSSTNKHIVYLHHWRLSYRHMYWIAFLTFLARCSCLEGNKSVPFPLLRPCLSMTPALDRLSPRSTHHLSLCPKELSFIDKIEELLPFNMQLVLAYGSHRQEIRRHEDGLVLIFTYLVLSSSAASFSRHSTRIVVPPSFAPACTFSLGVIMVLCVTRPGALYYPLFP